MGRIHLKKGIRELISAWTTLRELHGEWDLVIAGPDEIGLQRELERESSGSGVRFVGEVRGEEKARLLRESHAFILPSFSEGLPIAILEAWSYGLPVVMTRECNLPHGFAESAAAEVRPDVQSIATTLRTFLNLRPEELAEYGKRGRLLVQRCYSWTRVAKELVGVYDWLRSGDARPGCVHLD
jgi:poly(glycerol-phosphate) alpha-glucosyltransferase